MRVGDNVVWVRVSDRELLAVISPSDRYRVLADLMSGIELFREARLAAEKAYFSNVEESEDRRLVSSDSGFDLTGTVERISLR